MNLKHRSSLKYLGTELDENLHFGNNFKKLLAKKTNFSGLLPAQIDFNC